jgi:hypothetical protein
MSFVATTNDIKTTNDKIALKWMHLRLLMRKIIIIDDAPLMNL